MNTDAWARLSDSTNTLKSSNQRKDQSMIGQILSGVTGLAAPVAITPIFINVFAVIGC
jgi:hypothetical protein